ncbi:hypothetical protein Tco_1022714 [Tanacetum coccineum]
MTSDHNRSELGIQDHSNEQTSSKLVPKVVPLAVKTATSRQELELLFHLHIAMLRTTGPVMQMHNPISAFGFLLNRKLSHLSPEIHMLSILTSHFEFVSIEIGGNMLQIESTKTNALNRVYEPRVSIKISLETYSIQTLVEHHQVHIAVFKKRVLRNIIYDYFQKTSE